jgi:hypothetical protein
MRLEVERHVADLRADQVSDSPVSFQFSRPDSSNTLSVRAHAAGSFSAHQLT